MSIYEKRTYSFKVGTMPEVVRLYTDEGWPALDSGGFAKNLIGYFISDTGQLHQLVHIWRFESDSQRRDFWKRLYSDEDFMKFVMKVRAHMETQEVQLMLPAPWGPKP